MGPLMVFRLPGFANRGIYLQIPLGGPVKMQNRLGGVVCLGLAALAAASLHGQSSPVIGIVLSTRNGQVGNVPATPGVSVFSGDRLRTPKDSGLIVQGGKFQFWFHENTSATLTARSQGVALELEGGSASFSALEPAQTLEIFVSDIRIEPDSAHALHGYITIQNPCEIIVTSKQGVLKVVRGKQIKQVLEGSSVLLVPMNPVEPRPRGVALEDQTFHQGHVHESCPQPAGAKGRVMDWVYPVVFMEVAGVTAIWLAREGVSPSRVNP